MGPIDHFQVSPYWSHSSPVAWVMLHHHEVQNDARRVCKVPFLRQNLWHCLDTKRHKRFTCSTGNQHKEEKCF